MSLHAGVNNEPREAVYTPNKGCSHCNDVASLALRMGDAVICYNCLHYSSYMFRKTAYKWVQDRREFNAQCAHKRKIGL